MARILSNYERFYNLNTVNQIIWRWAPPDDGNATAIYADFVARKMGIKPDEVFNVRLNLLPLIKAMIEYENGQQPYSLETLTAGIALAVGDDS